MITIRCSQCQRHVLTDRELIRRLERREDIVAWADNMIRLGAEAGARWRAIEAARELALAEKRKNDAKQDTHDKTSS